MTLSLQNWEFLVPIDLNQQGGDSQMLNHLIVFKVDSGGRLSLCESSLASWPSSCHLRGGNAMLTRLWAQTYLLDLSGCIRLWPCEREGSREPRKECLTMYTFPLDPRKTLLPVSLQPSPRETVSFSPTSTLTLILESCPHSRGYWHCPGQGPWISGGFI